MTPQQQGKIDRLKRELSESLAVAGQSAVVVHPADYEHCDEKPAKDTNKAKDDREWAEYAESFMAGGG